MLNKGIFILNCTIISILSFPGYAQFTSTNSIFSASQNTNLFIDGLLLKPAMNIDLSNNVLTVVESHHNSEPLESQNLFLFDQAFSYFGKISLAHSLSKSKKRNEDDLILTYGVKGRTYRKNVFKDSLESYLYYNVLDPTEINKIMLSSKISASTTDSNLHKILNSEGIDALTVSFYPNPVKDKLMVRCENLQHLKSITVINLLGLVLFESSGKPINELDFHSYLPGLYIIKTILSSGSVKSFKVIKE